MLVVFTVGAGVGLGAAWWLLQDAPFMPAGMMAPPVVQDAADARRVEPGRPVTVRGISPSELPYDGVRHPDATVEAVPADEAPVAGQSAAAVASGASGQPSASAAGGGADETDAPADDETAAAKAGPGEDAPAAEDPAPAAAAKTQQASGTDKSRTPRTEKQGGAAADGTPAKRRPAARSMTEREIERIRQQAAEELRKKTGYGRPPGAARAALGARTDRARAGAPAAGAAVSASASMPARLARCDRIDSFISRELCRWRLCNGSWGRNGCPAYASHTASY